MEQTQAESVQPPAAAGAAAPQGIELRHLRYFVALADAGSFTHAAERIFVAQSTLSQQIRRLEEVVGAPLLQRRREGLRLTAAGSVLLDASRNVLSLVDHEVSRTRQAAGLGRPRLRMVMPPGLPESLAVAAAAGLRSAAATAQVEVVWLETVLDAEFSLIQHRRADAGLGWLTAGPEALPAPLDAMILGKFEPDVWIPSCHPAARRGAISLEELARLEVIYGPRRAQPGTYDAWAAVLRAVDPRFEFTDPPLRRSLPVTLAFAATGDRPTAVLTGPATPAGAASPIQWSRSADNPGMVRISLTGRPLTASAALVWNGDLPRALQQMLFETADGPAPPASAHRAELASLPVMPDAEAKEAVMFKSMSTWLIVRGVLAVIVGIIAIAWPTITVFALVIVFAVYAFVDAGLELARSFGSRTAGPVFGHLLLALIDIAAGIVALAWPTPTALVLVIVVAAWAFVGGFLELFAAFARGETAGTRAMFILAGLVSIAFGVVLAARPGIGAITLALLFGLYSLIFGVSEIVVGVELRHSGNDLHSIMAGAA